MRQREFGCQRNITFSDAVAALESCMSARRFENHQIGAVSVNMQTPRQAGDQKQVALTVLHIVHDLASRSDLVAQFLFAICPVSPEFFRCAVELDMAL